MAPKTPKREKDVSDNTRKDERSLLTTVLDFDVWLTQILAVSASPESPCGFLRPLMKLLEYSGDGMLWLPVVIIWNLASHQIETHHKLMNLLIVLIVDLIIVGTLKIVVRRKRPSHNQKDMIIAVAVDKYAFPSGHTTRAASVAVFVSTHFHLPYHLELLVFAWPVLIAASRVMLGRHHVLDVLSGIAIGVMQYHIAVNHLWLSEETCEQFIRPIQEELHI